MFYMFYMLLSEVFTLLSEVISEILVFLSDVISDVGVESSFYLLIC